MPISNSPNQITPMTLERARSFALRLSFMLPDDVPVNLTGGTVTFTMLQPTKLGTAVVLTKDATLVSPEIGYAVLDLQAAELDLDPAAYPYSITYVDADDYSATVVKGEVQIVSNTDPATGNVYDVLALDVELGFDNVVVTVNHLQAPTLQIGTVETVAYNNAAGAGIRGGYPHQLLDLKIPKGAPGGSQEAYDEAFGAAVAAANAYTDAELAPVAAAGAATQAELDGYEVSNDAALAAANAAIAAAQAELDAYEASNDTAVAAIISTMATDAELAAHMADTSTHGVGEVVGRTEAQALTNKDLTDLTNVLPDWLVPVGAILEWPGFTAPFGFLLVDGAVVSRATYPILWNRLTYQFVTSGVAASGQKVIPVADTSKMKVGMVVDGTGLGAGNAIASMVANTSITMTTNLTAPIATGVTLRLAPWGNGDGSTTFKLPSRAGVVGVGWDGTTEFPRLGGLFGAKTHTLVIGEIPSHSHGGVTGNDNQDHTHTAQGNVRYVDNTATGGTQRRITAVTESPSSNGNAIAGMNMNTTGRQQFHNHNIGAEGGGGAHNNVQPSIGMNYIIRAA